MTRIAVVSDVHLGNHARHGGNVASGLNGRCRMALKVLGDALVLARERKADRFIVAGDLFDTANPPPQLIAAAQELFTDNGIHPDLLLGNHEMNSDAKGDHALGPMCPVAQVIDMPTLVGDVVYVPFWPGPAREWLPKAVAMAMSGKALAKALVIHLGIETGDEPAWLRGCDDAVPAALLKELCAKYGFKAVFAGNWHGARMVNAPDPLLIQCGALVPTGFDNPGVDHYGAMFFYDTATGEGGHVTLSGPRFINMRWPSDLPPADGNVLHLSVVAEAGKVEEARAVCEHWHSAGSIAVFDVLPDAEQVRQAAGEAARAASTPATLRESVAEYVTAMPLPDDVIREQVLAGVTGYLKL
jgi:hypothetical protein